MRPVNVRVLDWSELFVEMGRGEWRSFLTEAEVRQLIGDLIEVLQHANVPMT